jgi:hypothetical protein
MSDIQRLSIRHTGRTSWAVPNPDGGLVTYVAHLAAVAAARAAPESLTSDHASGFRTAGTGGGDMSNHLPECFCTDTPLKPKRVRGLCICDRLAATAAGVLAVAREVGWQAGLDYAWPRGMEAARAEEAVSREFFHAEGYASGQRDVLAALDACQSVDDAVTLLKTIGLDITYTDEGLEVIARQIVRYGQRDAHSEFLTPAALEACGPEDPRYAKGQRDERGRIRSGVKAYYDSIDWVGGYSFDEAIQAVFAVIDPKEDGDGPE